MEKCEYVQKSVLGICHQDPTYTYNNQSMLLLKSKVQRTVPKDYYILMDWIAPGYRLVCDIIAGFSYMRKKENFWPLLIPTYRDIGWVQG